MARVLGLTSPHMHGQDVLDLQHALKKNAFDKDFMADGKVDGEFAKFTAQGCYRAQYWLGYAKPNQSAGTPLVAYLLGKRTLPAPMREKRAARIKKAADEAPLRIKAYKEALTHVGVKESPAGSNMQPFGKWYGWNGVAWCAIFQSYCAAASGSKFAVRMKRWAYCPYVVADAHAGKNGLTVVKSPKQGDWVIYGKSLAHHIEMFDHWITEGRTFAAIGGNTSPTDMSNGGEVYHYGVGGHAVRTMADVNCFAHLAG